jgi:hypothetical protein
LKLIKKGNKKYGLQKAGKKHRLYRIIKEYDNEQEAIKDLTRLLTGEATEQEIINNETEV